MATTKIKALTNTLGKAIKYITNPDKTDGSLLISSFGCSVEFADLEMQTTSINEDIRSKRKAYHLIQAFSPKDILTPEKAHSIGKEFADKVTGKKYEYVIATHIDQGHIHNHIIFNATSFVDHKKYRYSGVREKNRIRGISDNLCSENNLSVIENPSGVRGKSKYEYEQSQKGDSWKDKLRKAIDDTILNVKNFDEFLTTMELEYGYEIKIGKNIAFKAPDQERFTRLRRLGEGYTESEIKEKIEKHDTLKIPNSLNSVSKGDVKKERHKQKGINLIVDISKNIKAQSSKGYQIVLQRSNTENLIKTMNFLIDHNITTPEKFIEYMNPIKEKYDDMRSEIKKMDDYNRSLAAKIKYTQLYQKYRPVYLAYQSSKEKNDFMHQYGNEIALYRASLIYFEREELQPESMNYYDLLKEKKLLKVKMESLDPEFKKLKAEISELYKIEKNIESALNIKFDSYEKIEKRELSKNRKDMKEL